MAELPKEFIEANFKRFEIEPINSSNYFNPFNHSNFVAPST